MSDGITNDQPAWNYRRVVSAMSLTSPQSLIVAQGERLRGRQNEGTGEGEAEDEQRRRIMGGMCTTEGHNRTRVATAETLKGDVQCRG